MPNAAAPLRIVLTLACLGSLAAPVAAGETTEPETVETDVCIYAATPSGILAALAVERAGKDVLIVSPNPYAGGILGAGLKPMQDCPNYAATGGMTRDLLKTLGRLDPARERPKTHSEETAAIRADFQKLIDDAGIPVRFEYRVGSVMKEDGRIRSVTFDYAPFDELACPPAEAERAGALTVRAKVFIDAGYDGELLARAGVSYRVGREPEAAFDEQYAGVQPPMEQAPIDPFVTPGDPDSGLLKWVEDDHGKPVGAGDQYTQAYNYRYYTTSDPKHRLPITPPAEYSPQDYELVGRYVAHLSETTQEEEKLRGKLVGIFPGWKNSGEWNYQRSSLFSMAPVGVSYLYADGDYAEKARVWKLHQDYLRGLHRFMSTDPRVPEAYRKEVQALGLDGRAHPETHGWPHELYVRIARRLQGRYTITAHDVYNRTEVDDPIALAQYGIDTYPARRIWGEQDGETWVGIEGKMFLGGNKGPTNVPYPVPYRAITPERAECENLLVPVCFSATHLGYASARMEPVFMMCGESAGIAAVQAIEEGRAVQAIDLPTLLAALQEAGQKLSWDPAVDVPSNAGGGYSFSNLLRECDDSGDDLVSRAEWEAGKPNWEWLFPHIDTNADGQLNGEEYAAFQKFKKENLDWANVLRKAAKESPEP